MCDWGDTVTLRAPARSLTPNRIRNETVEVDRCLVDAVQELWAAGYATLGCCCAHGRGNGEITVVGLKRRFR